MLSWNSVADVALCNNSLELLEAGSLDPCNTLFQLRVRLDESRWLEWLNSLILDPRAARVQFLSVGWISNTPSARPTQIYQALVSANSNLCGLRGLFLGDVDDLQGKLLTRLVHDAITGLLQAFPLLEQLRVRGCNNLSVQPSTKHNCLKSLVIEGTQISVPLLVALQSCDFPALQHLELWLGMHLQHNIDTLSPLLAGQCFKQLQSLALRNYDRMDHFVESLLYSEIIKRIAVLDLSDSVLTDYGGEQLLLCDAFAHLERLIVRHTFLSPRIATLLHAMHVQVDDSESRYQSTSYAPPPGLFGVMAQMSVMYPMM
eukprot:TRINITY_DN12722_c0_g1_i1.p1 TRINITY_DN12722_c0_g1~~TRINITY_DN12722_c0_g1_i1.p1  ORF type:complete len:316 (-),score=26.23 TRINITY_DN12722_c0_g1_i1:29-976(-)